MECKKVKFADQAAALLWIAKLQRTSVRKDVPGRAYLCYECFGWHLTKTISREQKIINEQLVVIECLRREIVELKSQKLDRIGLIRVKTDERVEQLNKQILRLKEELKKSRQDNWMLIAKLNK